MMVKKNLKLLLIIILKLKKDKLIKLKEISMLIKLKCLNQIQIFQKNNNFLKLIKMLIK